MNADARKRSVKILLDDVSEDDEITLTVDGTEYTGEVSYKHYAEAEFQDGVPITGMLSLDVELTNESVQETDAPSHQVTIHAQERKPGRWRPAKAAVWDPTVEDGTIVEERYEELGTPEEVEIR